MHSTATSALPAPRRLPRGFTLIELLTVIAIIGILAAIIIPTVGRVRASARQAQGLANLRQIGTAIELFAGDNRNRFPPGVSTATNYSVILRPYVGQLGSSYADNTVASAIFKDPSAKLPTGVYHFSANPNFMPDLQNWTQAGPRPSDLARLTSRTVATRPTQQVLLIDGCQVNNGNSQATLYAVAGIFNPVGNAGENAVVRGPDVDASGAGGGGGHIRWRASGDTAAKCLWVDGHVSVMRQGELLQRHLRVD